MSEADRIQALEEETARLRAIVEAAVDAIITIDDRGIVESFNPAAERLFGYAAAEILGRNVSALMPEPYRSEHDGYIENYQRSGVRKIIGIGREVAGRRKDGTTFPMDLAVSEARVGDRRMFTGIVRDLTERKLHEERFRLAVESSPNGMVMADEAGRIVMINAAAEDLFGFRREELIGREIEALVPERFRAEHPRLRQTFGKKPESRRMGAGRDLFALRKDGTEFPVEIGLNPIRTAAGTFILSSIIDITERKQAEEQRRMMDVQLQQTQKLESLGVLAGGIAHDFNNLLVGILGNVELAIDDLPSNSPALGPLEDVVLAAKRLADLCKQMLAYSGKGRFVVAPVSLNAIVEEMSHLLSASISKKVLLNFRLAPNLPEINADATQMRQIVMNLIVNASDAIGDRSGSVTVTTGAMECDRAYLSETFFSEGLPEGRYVFLEASDTGCGMTPEVQARIFDPFFTTKFTGRGLGLAAVQGIVRGHGGAIRVYSESGVGTTFKMLFPALDQRRQEAGRRASADTEFVGQGLVLIVDDDQVVRSVARRALERLGFDVLEAADGESALDIFRREAQSVALVVMDLTMPKMDGAEAFREMRRVRKDVRVILSSGYNAQEVISLFSGKGLAGFVQKPFGPRDLLKEVRRVLQGD